jgi:hypothetical protein
MNDLTLADEVYAAVQNMMGSNTPFTVLDITNVVKENLSTARHWQVRDEVKKLYDTDIQPYWTRSSITVNLEDGSFTQAMLYHPASLQTHELDAVYDSQKRSQVSLKPNASVLDPNDQATISLTVDTNTTSISGTTTMPTPDARLVWKQLFDTQPSSFPKSFDE